MSRAFTLFALFTAGLYTLEAEVIGVDLTGKSEQDGKKPENADELVTSTSDFDSVLRLNRYTFQNTILKEQDTYGEVPHWIVLFCPPWYEPCQAITPIFKTFSQKWQDELNSALLFTEVRFATVDCATEKTLCNTQNVDSYPFVAHYKRRVQTRVWRGKSFDTDKQRLDQFLQKELGPAAAALKGPSPQSDTTEEQPTEVQNFRVDFLLIFAAIAGNAWFISRGSSGTEARANPTRVNESPVSVMQAAQGQAASASPNTSCLARSLPKEWAQERPSYEL